MLYYNNYSLLFCLFILLRFIMLENFFYYMLFIYLTSLICYHIFYVYPNKHSEQEINSTSFYFFIFFCLLSTIRDYFPPESTFCFCHGYLCFLEGNPVGRTIKVHLVNISLTGISRSYQYALARLDRGW